MWCVYAQVLNDQTKKYFWVFFFFWKWFYLSLVFWKFFPKSQIIFVLKNFFVSIFASASRVRVPIPKSQKCGSEFSIPSEIYTESLTTPSWVLHEICLPTKFALCKLGFWRGSQWQCFQNFVFASLMSLLTQNTIFSKNSTKSS